MTRLGPLISPSDAGFCEGAAASPQRGIQMGQAAAALQSCRVSNQSRSWMHDTSRHVSTQSPPPFLIGYCRLLATVRMPPTLLYISPCHGACGRVLVVGLIGATARITYIKPYYPFSALPVDKARICRLCSRLDCLCARVLESGRQPAGSAPFSSCRYPSSWSSALVLLSTSQKSPFNQPFPNLLTYILHIVSSATGPSLYHPSKSPARPLCFSPPLCSRLGETWLRTFPPGAYHPTLGTSRISEAASPARLPACRP
ncbi:hypothetical protein GGR52DRAFT_376211 [Hypoxylon sp. FL1284]|nr:hypothetical protein GGR52DRAFT_376211 [Hypoxylon sp. FL1284]